MKFKTLIVTALDPLAVVIGSKGVTGLVACLVTHDDADDTPSAVMSEAPFEFSFPGVEPGQYEIHIHGADADGQRLVDVFKTAIIVEPVVLDPYSPVPQRIELVDVPGIVRVDLI